MRPPYELEVIIAPDPRQAGFQVYRALTRVSLDRSEYSIVAFPLIGIYTGVKGVGSIAHVAVAGLPLEIHLLILIKALIVCPQLLHVAVACCAIAAQVI